MVGQGSMDGNHLTTSRSRRAHLIFKDQCQVKSYLGVVWDVLLQMEYNVLVKAEWVGETITMHKDFKILEGALGLPRSVSGQILS